MNLIKLYGERNTGTNYLSRLIRRNFEVSMLRQGEPRLMYKYLPDDSWPVNLYFKVQFPQHLGWKHALVKPEKIASQARIPLDKLLFVTLTKNPYSWLLSMYKRPYHAKVKAQSFEDFLASPWPTLQREDMPDAPDTPIDLWNRKNLSYIELGRRYHTSHFTYESLLADPITVLSQLSRENQLVQKQEQLQNISVSTKKTEKDYRHYYDYYLSEGWKEKLSSEAIAMINARLNREVMTHYGYNVLSESEGL